MRQCKYHKMAILYPNGMLSPEEKIRFEAHLDSCEECRALVSGEADLRNLFAEADSPGLPAGFEDRFLNSLKDSPAVVTPIRTGNFSASTWKLVPLAACFAVIMFVSVLFTPNNSVKPADSSSNYDYSYSELSEDEQEFLLNDEYAMVFPEYL